MKDKIIGIVIGIISGFIIFASIINLFGLYVDIDSKQETSIWIWISFFTQIITIILTIVTSLNYKKWKRGIVITIISILILSFIIPIRKEEEWKVINDTNPIGFCTFGGGFTTSEKYEVYYNIYGRRVFEESTGKIQKLY